MAGGSGRYYRVPDRFWIESRRWSDDAKLLAAYLRTCPHRNSIGLFFCPLTYIETDLGWTTKRLRPALEFIIDREFIAHDPDADLILLPCALSDQPPANEGVRKNMAGAFFITPPSPLKPRFLALAATICPALVEDIDEALSYASPAPSENRLETVSKPSRSGSGAVQTPSRKRREKLMGDRPGTDGSTDSFTDSVTESDKESTPSPPLSAERIADLWNGICGGVLPKIIGLTDGRKAKIRQRTRASRDEAWWRDYLGRIAGNAWMCGENDRGWRAGFDFAIRSEDVVTKVLEGQYDRHHGPRPAAPSAPAAPPAPPTAAPPRPKPFQPSQDTIDSIARTAHLDPAIYERPFRDPPTAPSAPPPEDGDPPA